MSEKIERPKVGLLLMAAKWFADVGFGKEGGSVGDLGMQIREDAEIITSHLAEHLDVVSSGLVFTSEEGMAAISRFRQEKVESVIACFVAWAEDYAWIPVIREIGDIPLLLWCYLPYDRPPSRQTMFDLCRNSGIVGMLQGSGTLRRLGKRFEFVLGGIEEKGTLQRILVWTRAASVLSELKKSIIGLLPCRNDQMKVTCVDEFRLMTEIGPAVRYIAVGELKRASDGIPEEEVTTFVNEIRSRYKVLPEVREKNLLAAARASLGMATLAKDLALRAIALNDISEELHLVMGLRPCLYPKAYDELGKVVGSEGDLPCTTAMVMLNSFTGRPVGFTEIFNVDRKDNTVVAGHAGPFNPALATSDKEVTITPDYEYIDSSDTYAGSAWNELNAAPGRVTMVNLLDVKKTFQIQIAGGESLGGPCRLTGYPHFYIRLDSPVEDFLREVVLSGTTQHWAVVHGDVRREMASLADMLGIEKIEI